VQNTNKFGFVAAKPIPQVCGTHSFYQWRAQRNPKNTQVVFTGDCGDPVRKPKPPQPVDQFDVLTGHTGSRAHLFQVAERRGILAMIPVSSILLGAPRFSHRSEWHWGTVYSR